MLNVAQVDAAMTINEVIARFPLTMPVFNRFGMDTCCGGGLAIDEVAKRHGIDVAAVMAALRAVTDPE